MSSENFQPDTKLLRVKVSFETKTASEIMIETKLHEKYAILQQPHQHETKETDDFTKTECRKSISTANTCGVPTSSRNLEER